MKKLIITVLSAALMVGCGDSPQSGGQGSGTSGAAGQKAPTRVRTEVLSAASEASGQTYVGIIEEREATAVSFTSMGVVKGMLVSEGQAVSKGQVLANMDSEQARNVLMGAKAQMAQADDALERYKMLHDAGSLPEAQWVEVQSKVEQAKAQLEVAQKNLRDCQLVAPVSGIVGKVLVKAGETALPSQAVVTILDVSSLKVKVAIPEAEIGGVKASSPTLVTVDAVGQSFHGGRIEKGVQADALTHTYDIRIHLPNPGRILLPGMVASVLFTTPSAQQAERLTLPVTAVQGKADGTLFVWTVGSDSTAHREAVTIGDVSGNRVTIASGLDSGRRVVVEGFQKLSEGTRVVF